MSDALFHYSTIAVLGLGLWYVVRYTNFENASALKSAFNVIVSALIIVGIWQIANELILNALFEGEAAYLEFLVQVRIWRVSMGFIFYALIFLLYVLTIYYQKFQERKLIEANLQKNITEANLDILRNQINPHFLFNSLNSIAAISTEDGLKTRQMIGKLSELLRYSLSHKKEELILLSEELELAENYIQIEKVRFGEKINYQIECSNEALKSKIPNMILQPLLENAIKYGVQEAFGEIEIKVSAKINNGLELQIINDLEEGSKGKKGTGLGQNHIKERLSLLYDDKFTFQTEKQSNSYKVFIKVPLKD